MLALKPLARSSFLQCHFAWGDQRLTFMSTYWPDHSFVSAHDGDQVISWIVKNKL